MRIPRGAVIAFLVAAAPAGAALASDHHGVDEGLPIHIEDAFPISFRGVELQVAGRGEALIDGPLRGTLHPELKAGLFRNGHAWLGGTLATDPDEHAAEGGVLVNFNAETPFLPAFSVAARVAWGFSGLPDLTARGIVTRSFGVHRLHLNAEATWLGAAEGDESRLRPRLGVAGDRPFGLTTLALVGVSVTGGALQDLEGLLEAGLRHQLDPDQVLSVGVGLGWAGAAEALAPAMSVGYSRSF